MVSWKDDIVNQLPSTPLAHLALDTCVNTSLWVLHICHQFLSRETYVVCPINVQTHGCHLLLWLVSKEDKIYSGTKNISTKTLVNSIIPMQKLNIDISMQIVTVAVHTLLFITYMFTSNFYTRHIVSRRRSPTTYKNPWVSRVLNRRKVKSIAQY